MQEVEFAIFTLMRKY